MSSQISQSYSFLPTSVSPGCSLWLDAADPSSVSFGTGSNINQWNDKSGNGYNATQFNTGFATYNGSNQVTISPTGQLVCSIPPGTFSAGISGFVVFNSYFTNDTAALISRTIASLAAPFDMFNANTGGTTRRFVGNPLGYGLFYTTTDALYVRTSQTIYGFFLPAAVEWNESVNGTYTSIAQTGSVDTPAYADTGSNIVIGSRDNKVTVASIYVYEIILYNRTVTTSQRQQIEGYLAWKWGLQTNLPASHPYKNNGPFANIPSIPTAIIPTRPIQMSSSVLFDPLSVAGCQLWLDAADTSTFVLSASKVTRWNDKSTNRYNVAQANSGRQPSLTTSPRGVALSGAVALTQTAGNVPLLRDATALTILTVARVTTTISNNNLMTFWFSSIDTISSASSPKFYIQLNGANNIALAWNGASSMSSSNSVTENTSAIIGAVLSSTASTDINGTLTSTAGASLNAASADALFTLGYPDFTETTVYEILIYNRELTSVERQYIEGYLAFKWSLQSSLPSNHPYRTVPFVPQLRQIANTSFRPTSITGCALWLDAADGSTLTLTGSNVTQWNDKSGNANNATASTPPTYNTSRRTIVFNGSTQFMSLPNGTLGTGSTTYSCFFVASTNSPNSAQWVLVQGNTTTGQLLGFFFWSTQALFHSWWLNEYGFNNVTSASTNIIAGYTYDGTTRLTFANGTSSTANVPGIAKNTTANDSLIGKRAAGEFLNGTVSEIIFYTGFLTTTQRQQIEGYLAWKWGLVGNLPANHPYKKWPPPPA